MSGIGSYFKVVDNSGAVYVKCIGILGRSGVSYVRSGNVMTAVVKRSVIKYFVKKRKVAKRGQIHRCVLLNDRSFRFRLSGNRYKFSRAVVVLLKRDEKYLPFANRIKVSVVSELRSRGFTRILAMASDIY